MWSNSCVSKTLLGGVLLISMAVFAAEPEIKSPVNKTENSGQQAQPAAPPQPSQAPAAAVGNNTPIALPAESELSFPTDI